MVAIPLLLVSVEIAVTGFLVLLTDPREVLAALIADPAVGFVWGADHSKLHAQGAKAFSSCAPLDLGVVFDVDLTVVDDETGRTEVL